MRDFEKRLSLKLKEEAAMEEINQCSDPNIKLEKRISRKRRIVSAVIVAFLFISIFGIDYLSESKGEGHSFQIITFAESEGIDENQLEERLLDANLSMVMPNGQIMLHLNDRYSAYGWGTGSFYVTGKDIVRVTYSLKKGKITHYDSAMEYKQNLEGNPVRIEFFLPYSLLDLDESQINGYELENQYTQRLKELWNSGDSPELEAVKKSYFAGKSLNIDDYTIMNFVGTWSAAQTDGRYFRCTDTMQDEQLTREAQTVTVEYYHFDYGEKFNFDDSIYDITWSPSFKPNEIQGITNPEDLPGDEMTVTIELQNGEIVKKIISLDFDENGYVVATIMQ